VSRNIRVFSAGMFTGMVATVSMYLIAVKLVEPPTTEETIEWSIGIYAGSSPLNLEPATGASNPVLAASDVTDINADFVADPFVIRDNNQWFMFFEVLNSDSDHGDLGLATSADGLSWSYQQIILDEPFHLSYPQVFEWAGDYYMIPETYQADAVRLYKAVQFPHQWILVQNLMGGLHLDPTVFRHNDRWWMFTTTSLYNDVLRLYWASELNGDWQEHPSSPLIYDDASRARPAGRVLRHNDRLYRLTQDDLWTYGKSVHAFEILELSGQSYREQEVVRPVLMGSGEGWNAEGMHHVDHVQLGDDNWLATVDGWRRVVTESGWKLKLPLLQ